MPKNQKTNGKIAPPVKTKISGTTQIVKLRKTKKFFDWISSLFFSPVFNVAALVLLFLSVFAAIRILNARKTVAQVNFVERADFNQPEGDENEKQIYSAPDIFSGEVYDTSIRLRETGALGMAISLTVFAEFSEKGSVPSDFEQVWNSIRQRGLLPPEIAIKNGEIASPSNAFVVRYQSQPLRFEILSHSSNGFQSPAILLRFPLTSLDGRTLTYFQSASAARFDAPEPFTSMEKVIASGWTIEQWRGEILPNNENSSNMLAEEKRLLGEINQNH